MSLIAETKDYVRGGTQKETYSSDEVIEVSCLLCGCSESERLYTEHGSIGIVKCLSCSLIYASPRIHSPEQVYWGDGTKYYDEARLIFEGKAAHHRDPNYLGEIKAIERYKRRGRFLDVGCNMGMLLRLASKRGWEAVGVEPSASLSELSRKHGFKVYNCFLNELPENEERSFDVVAFSDVFEHITEPVAFLHEAARFLKPDGILYVKVPNAKWNLFKQHALALMGRRPEQGIWDSYEHVAHYTDKTLRKMLDRGGFQTIGIGTERPVQVPVWHYYIGHYYQYPSPWVLDWRRHIGRSLFYFASKLERALRFGSIGNFAPNIVAIAKRKP